MNDWIVPDHDLEAMLARRAGENAPADLHASILALVSADSVSDRRRVTGPATPTRSRTIRLLAIAAVVGTVIGGSLLLGGSHERAEVIPDPSLPDQSDGVDAVTVPILGGASITGRTCLAIPVDTGAAAASGVGASGARADGALIVSVSSGSFFTDLVALDADAPDPHPRPLGLAIDQATDVVASSDGRLLAIAAAGDACREPILVDTAGGNARFPIAIDPAASLRSPVWSSVGSTLYLIHEGIIGPNATTPERVVDRGSVWAFDPATGAVDSLGSPCDGCRILGLTPLHGTAGVAATTVPGDCYAGLDDPARPAECPGEALSVAGADGIWRTMAIDALPDFMDTLGWQDANTLVYHGGEGIHIASVDDPATATTVAPGCCANGSLSPLSPDGTKLVRSGARSGSRDLDVIDLTDGSVRTIGLLPLAGDGGQTVAWAPDSRSLAIIQSAGGESAELWVLDIDTASWQRFATGPLTRVTWLAAAP